MTFFIFFILFLVLSSVGRDRRRSDFFKFLFGFFFICMIVSVVVPPLAVVAVIALIIWLIKKIAKSKPQETPEDTYRRPQQNTQRSSQNNKNPYSNKTQTTRTASSTHHKTVSTILPRPVTKRLRIIQDFNDTYNLTLTPEQMQRIVDSSYMSEAWKLELEAMSERYETIYEWFQGDSRYLRAYIHAFQIQEISSDILQQEQICIQAFEQVWNYADSLLNLSLEERIARVNETYYAHFDNITFMIAYRFLEEHGYHHKLDTMDLIHDESDIEELMKKYDQTAGKAGR